ncbi:unnamed protein product [Acanthoscelides obtectus]|uniref:Transposase n=1 Tax=Acanthoscelides obtectus TaxID=200917 RepID=A0A9P0L4K7_ACAOB|nr:unnamed protein product [Acanthoscelides obtectus]CAK1651208.1 Histone-lysine N-methyltransferase SETMAR [Acanthoscelides obtectus]
MELNREHFRAIIYYNFQRQLSQQECLAELLSVFGNEAPHQSTIITRWYGEFKRGRSDDSRSHRCKLIIEDRHVTYREIEAKLVSRWIPHLLTNEQKAARVNWCQKRLTHYCDELWIYCYQPENKRQSAVWVFQGEEKRTKVIRSRSVSKTGHIATIPLNEQITVTADWYTTICLPKVITQLRKINPERRIILHQDNASSHTAQRTRQYLTEENVELLDHPPYSPDLSPNDLFTFPKIKNRLRGQRFQSPEDAFKNAEEIVIWRREYLRKNRQFRAEGRKIYYLDETWVNAGHTQGKVWAFLDGLSTGLKNPAGSVDGFVPEALWAFESKKTGDYHEEMDGNSFENWFKKILPTLDDNAIIVMDNAPYHSRKLEKIPTMATKKADIQQGLKVETKMWDMDNIIDTQVEPLIIDINNSDDSSSSEYSL